jgi:hypothetical protein
MPSRPIAAQDRVREERIARADAKLTDPLARSAARVLIENDMGFAVKPSPRLYPHQWNWDSGFIAMGLAVFDVRRAEREVAKLLEAQWKNGMVPHIVFNPKAKDYFPGPEFWRTDRAKNAPGVPTSGHSQPPVLATAARTVVERNTDDPKSALRFLRKVYPRLLRQHAFWTDVRDLHDDGIYYSIHPWETGRDNSPEWVELMRRIHLDKKPQYRRRDTSLVDSSERPTEDQYDRYAHLVEVFREADYDEALIRERSPFLADDVLTNALVFKDTEDLVWIAKKLGASARSSAEKKALDRDISALEASMKKTRASFSGHFWNDRDGLFYSFDHRTNRPIEINTAATFMPLYAGLATETQAKRLVEEHLSNPDEYGLAHPIPSTSRSEGQFDPKRYWLGPTWINVNWMAIKGLERYGYAKEAEALKQKTLDLMREHGLREYYDPSTGAPCGAEQFSWSAALALDLMSG